MTQFSARRAVKSPDGHTQNIGLRMLPLSLFLILLAFFIVLYTSSKFEEHLSRPVIESISKSFSAHTIEDKVIAGNATQKGGGTALEKVEGIFTSHSFSVEKKKHQGHGALFMSLPIEDLEEALDQFLTLHPVFERYEALFFELSQLGDTYHMSVMINWRDLENGDFLTQGLYAFAELFEEYGFQDFSIGAHRGKEKFIDLIFTEKEAL